MKKESTYVYDDPETDGFVKFHLPRRKHNEIITYRKCRIFDTIDAYYREDEIILEYTTSAVGKLMSTLLLPISVLMYGLSSTTETFTAWKKMFEEKKYGVFIRERINKDRFRDQPNEKFLLLEKEFKSQQKKNS